MDAEVMKPYASSMPVAHHYESSAPPASGKLRTQSELSPGELALVGIVLTVLGLHVGLTLGLFNGIQTQPTFVEQFHRGFSKGTLYPAYINDAFQSDLGYQPYGWVLFKAISFGLLISGCAVGALLVGPPISDQFGRVPAIALGALFSIGGIASTIFGLTISTFLIGMALQGIGVGILSHAGPVYMAESVPRDNRKAFGSIIPVAIATGFVVAQALMFVNSRRWNWQWVLGIPFISAGLVLVIGIFLPETNVYKNIVNLRAMGVNVGERVRDVEMGRSGAPVGSSTSSAGAPIVRENLSYPDDPNDREAVPIPVCHPAGLAGMGGVEECERHRRWDLHVQRLMSQPSLRNRSLVATAMQWFQQLTGFIMFVGFANFVFSQASIGDRLVLSLIFFGANLLGTAVAVGVLDQVPRKPLLLAGGIMMTICLVIAGAIVTAKHEKLAHRYSIVVSVFLCLYAFVFAATWGPLAWVYPAEMFPTAHRFEGVSMSAVNQWAAMIIFAFASSIMLRRLNVGPTLLFFMAFTAVGTVLAGLLPETLDVDPDSKQMDQLFGGSGQGYEFADKRAALPVSGAQVPASSAPSYAPSSGYEPHPFTAPSHGARLNPPAQSTLPSTYDKPTLPHVSAPATSPRTEQAATAAYRQAERERARATGRAM